jgi:hypothetical protein
MLPSVLFARDRYLVDPTHVYPNLATMFVGGIECKKWKTDKIDFWSNVYGFDMSILVDDKEKFCGSSVEIVKGEQLLTTSAVLKDIKCGSIFNSELDFSSEFELEFVRDHELDAFCVWFTTTFDVLNGAEAIVLSTAPTEPATHWMHTVFRLQEKIVGKTGQKVKATLEAKRMKAQPRSYSVTITYSLMDGDKNHPKYVQHYTVE